LLPIKEGDEMDFMELSREYLHKMQMLGKAQIQISDAVRGEAFILRYIAMRNGEAVPGDISKEMSISSARVATVLNSLENKGMVMRNIDQADHRRTILKLTSKGEEYVREKMQKILKSTAELFEQLGEHDAKEFVRIVGRLGDIHINHQQ